MPCVRRSSLLVWAAAGLMALGGCRGSQVGAGSARPGLPTPPSLELPTPAGPSLAPLTARPTNYPDYPACFASQLSASASGLDGLTGGTLITRVSFRNVSMRACVLTGTPMLTALGRRREVLPHHEAALDGDFGHASPVVLLPMAMDPAFLPVSITSLNRAGDNSCPTEPAEISYWRVTLPAGRGSVIADARAFGIATCDGGLRSGAITLSES